MYCLHLNNAGSQDWINSKCKSQARNRLIELDSANEIFFFHRSSLLIKFAALNHFLDLIYITGRWNTFFFLFYFGTITRLPTRLSYENNIVTWFSFGGYCIFLYGSYKSEEFYIVPGKSQLYFLWTALLVCDNSIKCIGGKMRIIGTQFNWMFSYDRNYLRKD